MNIRQRLKVLEAQMQDKQENSFTVYFKDGSQTTVYGADIIYICLEMPDKIEKFVEHSNGKNNGCLCGLCNALLK